MQTSFKIKEEKLSNIIVLNLDNKLLIRGNNNMIEEVTALIPLTYLGSEKAIWILGLP